MNIVEFFQQSSGKWFSQRTSHHLARNQSKGGKSDIVIDVLSSNDPAIIQLCQQYEVETALALCGVRITWNGTMEFDGAKHTGSTVLVPLVDTDHPNQGTLLQAMGNGEKVPVTSRYSIGSDEALTLITEQDTLYAEERLWFASPNLRLRTSLLKHSGIVSMTSFYSEIRMGGAPAAQASTAGSVGQAK
jgi:hypothetical protein